MSRTFLFGNNSGAQSQSRYLVEFRAGKMNKNGNTVSADKRKGTVYLHRSGEDSLMHFCWKDRTSGAVEDDLIIFPDDAEFVRVTQCTTGRAYLLKFKNSTRRLFFWMQEPKDDKDEEYCQKINDYINNRSSSAGSGALSPSSALADLSSLPDGDIQGLLNNMSPQQLMSILSGGSAHGLASLLSGASSSRSQSNVSTPAPQTPSTTPAERATNESSQPTAPAIQLSDLQSIISGLTAVQQQKENEVNVDMSSSITLEALQPLLSNDEFMSRVRSLLPSTASAEESSNTSAEVKQEFSSTVQSPQFKQALGTFSTALQSGQLGPLIQQFGLSQTCVDAANAGDLEAFVKALQAQQKDKPKDDEKPKADDKPKDDDMALD